MVVSDTIRKVDMECRQFYAHCFSKWKDNSFENSLLKLCRKICLNSKGILPSTNIFCEMSDVHSFKNGYQKMCDYLFLQKSTSSYAIALITFSLELDKQMSRKYTDWYTTDLLIDILDTNLRKINFKVEIVNQEIQTNYWLNIYLTIVPIVLTIVLLIM